VDLPLLKEVIEPVPELSSGELGADGFENGFGLVQSGFGLEIADQSLETLKELDLDNKFGALDDTVLTGLTGIDLSTLPGGTDMGEYLGGLLGIGEAESIDGLIDKLYDGEIEDFLTHFNRGNEAALHHAINWRCELFSLNADRCATARQLASEDVENRANGLLPDIGGDIGGGADDPLDQITDVIETGLNNIQVTEGSGGSFEWVSIGILLLICLWGNLIMHSPVRLNIRLPLRDTRH
jgi:hypothetical protein